MIGVICRASAIDWTRLELTLIHLPQEFEQLKVRDDELDELDNLTHDCAEVRVAGGSENVHGKVGRNNFQHLR